MKKNVILLLTAFLPCSISLSDSLSPEVLDSYHKIQHALAYDEFVPAQGKASELYLLVKDTKESWTTALTTASEAMAKTTDSKTLRKAFEKMSEAIVETLRKDEALKKEWTLFYCPMAPGYRYWAQPNGEKICNPYFGHEMLHCGSKKPW